MSRVVKRVPMDFDAELGETWPGYLMPESLRGTPCPHCYGGQTHFGWWLQNISYQFGMLAEDVRDQEQGKPMHPWLAQATYHHGHFDNHQFVIDRPGPDALTFIAKLAGIEEDEITGFLGGSSSHKVHYALYHKLEEITGLSLSCTACDDGSTEVYPGQKAERDAWTPSEPPEGPGYQLWQTVSDGGPVSPVFATAGDLAGWMVEMGEARNRQWALGFIAEGSSHATGYIDATTGEHFSGVDFVGRRHAEEH